MPDVSYLITYRNSGPDRQANLDFILKALTTLPEIEIILVEQDRSQQIQENHLPENCQYLFACNPGHFNKSWGLNLAARLAATPVLLMADADMLLTRDSFTQITEQFKQGADAVNPYSLLIDLQEAETIPLLNGQDSLTIQRTEQRFNRLERKQHPPFCGGIFALSRDLYTRIGGFDERFTGWGAEDDAMSMRLLHFACKAVILTGHIAYHLWHKPVVTEEKQTLQYLYNVARLSAYYEYGDRFIEQLATTDRSRQANIEKYLIIESNENSHSTTPLISCLCVTRARVKALRQAIHCFKQQVHKNTELLIVCEDDDTETLAFTNGLSDPAIRTSIVLSNPKRTLGELRNHAIDAANGEYVCQWDDDDWYHPRRLELQLQSALEQNKAASVLPRWLIYSHREKKAYCSNVRLWEGSLLCKKSILQSSPGYPEQSKGEDSAVISWLYIQDQLAIEDRPDLYIYRHNGSNTWDQKHFQKILESSTPLNAEDAQRLGKLMEI